MVDLVLEITLPYRRTWLWLCHARIVVSPSCGLGGSTTGETTSPPRINAGTAESCRVSPPEAVAYPLELSWLLLSFPLHKEMVNVE